MKNSFFRKYKNEFALYRIRKKLLTIIAVLLVLSAGLPLWLWGSFAPLAAAAGYGLAVWYGYRNLDGMSGDISGFALTLGELCGCAAAILWR